MDLLGNAAEWCSDSPGPGSAIVKGGCWFAIQLYSVEGAPPVQEIPFFEPVPSGGPGSAYVVVEELIILYRSALSVAPDTPKRYGPAGVF